MTTPEEYAHQEWLGYVQPVGLVVSIPALVEAQCYIQRGILTEHARFLACLARSPANEPLPELRDFAELTSQVLGWEPADLTPVPRHGELPGALAQLEASCRNITRRSGPPMLCRYSSQPLVRIRGSCSCKNCRSAPRWMNRRNRIRQNIGTRPRRLSSNGYSAKQTYRSDS